MQLKVTPSSSNTLLNTSKPEQVAECLRAALSKADFRGEDFRIRDLQVQVEDGSLVLKAMMDWKAEERFDSKWPWDNSKKYEASQSLDRFLRKTFGERPYAWGGTGFSVHGNLVVLEIWLKFGQGLAAV